MDSEPPSKRRRKGELFMDDLEDEEDDDELMFQPDGIEANSDPGYRFSIERAYSDHRFQATMAHIFEKYGRDFQGIGDEIDLMTGEIVVNNGHIHNMRDEGDVGDDFLRMEDGGQDEEGILLEELTDEDYHPTDQAEENQESEPEKDLDKQTAQGRHSRDHGQHDYQSPHHSMALVARTPAQSLAGTWGIPPFEIMPTDALWHRPYATSPFGFGVGFGARLPPPLTLSHGSSPMAFGVSPFSAGPWDILGPSVEPQWTYPQPKPLHSLDAGHRYNFKAQRGQSSIWARRSKYKEDENEPLRSVFDMALDRQFSTSKPTARKTLPAPPAIPKSSGDDEDEDDEEAILSGKSANRKKSSTKKSRKWSHSRDDDQHNEAGLLLSNNRMTKRQHNGMRKAKLAGPAANRSRKTRKSTQGLISEEDGYEIMFDSADASIDNCSSSSRTRRQVKLSNGSQCNQEPMERNFHHMLVELPPMSQQSRKEYQAIEVIDCLESDLASCDGDGRHSLPVSKTSHTWEPIFMGAHNDSEPHLGDEISVNGQNTLTPTSGHALGRNKPSKDDWLSSHKDSVYVFSDDEAPIILAKVKVDSRGSKRRSTDLHRLRRNTGANEPSVEPLGGFEAREEIELDNGLANLPHLPKDDEEAANKREIPESSIAGSEAHSEQCNEDGGPSEEVEDGATQSENALAYPSGYSSDTAPFSSSPTRALARYTARVSLNDKPDRLLRELRWLRKQSAASSPLHSDLPETPSSPTAGRSSSQRRGRSRSRKSIGAAQEPEPTGNYTDRQTDPQAVSPAAVDDAEKSRKDVFEDDQEQTTDEATEKPARSAKVYRTRSLSRYRVPPHQSSPQPVSHQNAQPPKPVEPPTSITQIFKTPRHRQTSTRSPSSRQSILSLAGTNADNEEVDELRRGFAAMPGLHSSPRARAATSARKIWKSSALTTEIYHTPIKKRGNEPVSPGSLIRTPGGTLRTCGRDGYRCGRDFCFTCL